MGSTFWIAIAVIAVAAILVRGVVSIVVVSKSGGGKFSDRVTDLESQIDEMETQVEAYRERIEVLEKIVTDQKYDLGREINDLAANK